MVAVAPLCLITDRAACRERTLDEVVAAAVAGGARWVQYREKGLTRRARYEAAARLRELTRRLGAALIVNDELDLAVAVDADGLHLGQEDLPLEIARAHIGPGRFIGVSTHTLEEARAAADGGADYIAVGPIFDSPTTAGRPAVGCEALRRARAAVGCPIVAIGGVTPANAPEAVRAGADGVAVISALCGADDPAAVAREFLRAMETALRR
jgi:thiamine-phosphate pyrophosphorylase